MEIFNSPFFTLNWNEIKPVQYAGERGFATLRTVEHGNIRTRIVEYSPGYLADHWCERGHVLYVLEGELLTELKDGRKFTLKAGMSYQVSSGMEPHRSTTDTGVKLFIVD